MGVIEIAMRGSSTRKTNHIFQPIVGTSFDSAADVNGFYNLYYWVMRFGINYGREGVTLIVEMSTEPCKNCSLALFHSGFFFPIFSFCFLLNCHLISNFEFSNQRFDKRCVHQSQRCGCKAVIILLRTDDHG